jgi:phosphoenolpyruvate carboxykinase (ATP)
MNNNTPFTKRFSLTDLGIENAKIHYHYRPANYKQKTVALGQGVENLTGALAINTGEFTGRSPQIDLL